MSELHVLRVFPGPDGEHGNELGVFLRGREAPPEQRQTIAADLGFAETVFVDDPGRAEIRIFAPGVEMPFAGHPAVGTAWLLWEQGHEVDVLRLPAGDLPLRREAGVTWIAARAEWAPPFEYLELPSAPEVDALSAAPGGEDWAYCWAWEDEEAGQVRARSFVVGAGIAEDEATGSAGLALCAQLGRPIRIRQGMGSEILARPVEGGYTEVGGRVVLDAVRAYEP